MNTRTVIAGLLTGALALTACSHTTPPTPTTSAASHPTAQVRKVDTRTNQQRFQECRDNGTDLAGCMERSDYNPALAEQHFDDALMRAGWHVGDKAFTQAVKYCDTGDMLSASTLAHLADPTATNAKVKLYVDAVQQSCR